MGKGRRGEGLSVGPFAEKPPLSRRVKVTEKEGLSG